MSIYHSTQSSVGSRCYLISATTIIFRSPANQMLITNFTIYQMTHCLRVGLIAEVGGISFYNLNHDMRIKLAINQSKLAINGISQLTVTN